MIKKKIKLNFINILWLKPFQVLCHSNVKSAKTLTESSIVRREYHKSLILLLSLLRLSRSNPSQERSPKLLRTMIQSPALPVVINGMAASLSKSELKYGSLVLVPSHDFQCSKQLSGPKPPSLYSARPSSALFSLLLAALADKHCL